MALFGQCLLFPGKLPSADQVSRIVRKAMAEGPVSVRSREAGVSFTLPADRAARRRRARWINVRARGQQLSVMGTHGATWGAVCSELQSLGGVPQLPARSRPAPSPRV